MLWSDLWSLWCPPYLCRSKVLASRLAPVHVLSDRAVVAPESRLLRAHRVWKGIGLWECSAHPSLASWPCSSLLPPPPWSQEPHPVFHPHWALCGSPACPALFHCQTLLRLPLYLAGWTNNSFGNKIPPDSFLGWVQLCSGRLHSGTEVVRAASTHYGQSLFPGRDEGRWQRGTKCHFSSHLFGQRESCDHT